MDEREMMCMKQYMELLNMSHVVSDQFAYRVDAKCNDYRVIQILYLIEQEKCNQKTLASKLGMTEPALSMKLKLLERNGLITKEKGTVDKRHYSLHLTNEGLRILNTSMPIIEEEAKEMFSILTEEENEILFGLLKKLER